MPPSAMNICLLVLWGDSLTYTLAKALAFQGHQVRVWVADIERHNKAIWGTPQRIAAIPGVTIVVDAAARVEGPIDLLIVQGHPLLLGYRTVLDALARYARRITAISAGDRSRSFRQALHLQWRELKWYGRWLGKVKRVAYKDGYYPFDLFALLKPRAVVGFDAHAKFLQDEALFRAIHDPAWDADTPRPIRANFMGSKDPAVRERILRDVGPVFTALPSDQSPPQKMLWHVYSDAQPGALSPEEFVMTLSESDFTLAPPGYSLVTHRPVEALLRGSIPVLNATELDLYALGLADGVNCIAVPPGGWSAAMRRIMQMTPREIAAMRRDIKAIVAERVAYPALSRDIARRLGVHGAERHAQQGKL